MQNIGSSGGYGGGTFYNVTPSSLAGALGGTPFTTTGAAAYAVPANSLAVLVGQSNAIGAGALLSGGASIGLAYNLSSNLIVPIGTSLTNTNVTLGE